MIRTGTSRRPHWKRRLRNTISVLETYNHPLTRLFCQYLYLDTLTQFRNIGRSLGTRRRSAYIGYSNVGSQKPNLNVGDRESALFENERKSSGEFILDFRATFPPLQH
jgi:hypothetical protein